MRLRGVPASEIDSRVNLALTNLGLGALAARLPHQLSGGQQQRVAIARALVYNPPVVLMDEPLSNLDAKLREEARAWLRELIVRLGLSALVVTHDQTEAMAMSDKILLLNSGRIEQQGTPEDLYNRPQTQFTAEFMGSNNQLSGRVSEMADGRALLEGEGWRLWGAARGALKTGDAATGIIRLERTRIANGAGDNRLRTELVTGMFLGDRKENLFKLGAMRLRCYGTPVQRCRRQRLLSGASSGRFLGLRGTRSSGGLTARIARPAHAAMARIDIAVAWLAGERARAAPLLLAVAARDTRPGFDPARQRRAGHFLP